MAHHGAENNNPKKELMFAMIGTLMFLALVSGVVIPGFLRPAGDHYPAQLNDNDAARASLVNGDSQSVAPAQAMNAGQDTVEPTTATTADGTAAPVDTAATTAPSDATIKEELGSAPENPTAPTGEATVATEAAGSEAAVSK